MVELLMLVMLVTASCLFGNGFVAAVEDLYEMGAERLQVWRRRGQLRTASDDEREAMAIRECRSQQGRI